MFQLDRPNAAGVNTLLLYYTWYAFYFELRIARRVMLSTLSVTYAEIPPGTVTALHA